MQTILESPIYVGVIGGIAAVVCLWVAIQTGYRLLYWAGLAAAAITAVLVTVSVQTVTPREEVIAYLHDAADDLEANRLDELRARIHPAAAEEVHSLQAWADRLHFTLANIRSIHEVTVTGEGDEQRAVAKFNVFVECEAGGAKYRMPRYVELTMYKVDGRWLVHTVLHRDPTYAMRRQPLEE